METPLVKCDELARQVIKCSDRSRPVATNDALALYIKREDLNPSGSHKDRALVPYVDALRQAQGDKNAPLELCLSSSGNLAIAAAHYAQTHSKVRFHLFIPQSLSEGKWQRLIEHTPDPSQEGIPLPRRGGSETDEVGNNVVLHWSQTPKHDSIIFAREKGVRLIRGSTDDGILEGYHALADELMEQMTNDKLKMTDNPIGSIFIAVSSGTAAAGLWEGLKKICHPEPSRRATTNMLRQAQHDNVVLPQLHIVQTTKVHPIAGEFDKDFTPTKTSIASAIVDRVAHRKEQVVKAVKESGGSGWIVSDEEIEEAQQIINDQCRGEYYSSATTVSPESAMSLAGLKKALAKDFPLQGLVVLVFTGN